MNRGFALVTVLWLVVVLAGLVSLTGPALSLARPKAENRIQAMRGRWAARACADIFRARFALDTGFVGLDSVSLGPDIWCSVSRLSPSAKLGLNQLDEDELLVILGDEALAAAILDWRDADDDPRPGGAEQSWYATNHMRSPPNTEFRRTEELLEVRGVTPAIYARLIEAVDPLSGRRIDPNIAPLIVLQTIRELPPGGAEALDAARARGNPFRSERDVADALRAGGHRLSVGELARLGGRLTFSRQPEALTTVGTLSVRGDRRSTRLLIPVAVQDARLLLLSEQLR